jgi:hypothetical protein
MIPAGYLLKRVKPPPGWLADPRIFDVCSVAGCVNDTVADPQDHWKHNALGLADNPSVLWSLAKEQNVDPEGSRLFYFEAYEKEIASDGWTFDSAHWAPLSLEAAGVAAPDVSAPTGPQNSTLLGFDVVVFGDFLEHSPLSCNGVAGKVSINKHCLFDTFDQAKQAIDSGAFSGGCEEGIYRIFSVAQVGDAVGLRTSLWREDLTSRPAS